MRTLKTSGGVTRGGGLTEQQRLTWLLAMPATAEISRTVQELTGINYNSGEQNKDITNARKERDKKDTLRILSALENHNPFSADPHLRNIINGVHGDSSVNVDKAKEVGDKVLSSLIGESPLEYTLKKSGHAVTLATKSSIKIDNENVQVDPQLLFQRLILASNQCEDLTSLFCYELCTYPASLFDSSLMLLQPNKPTLADAVWLKLSPQTRAESAPKKTDLNDLQYVLNGGALLHRIVWPSPGSATYKEVCNLYCSYVTKKYGTAVVVFDGYGHNTTKQMTQQRRSSGKTAAEVSFTGEMKINMKKDLFLSNKENKQRFICMLSSCQIQQWKGEEIDPEEWGWKLQENQIIPITTDLPPATDSLLKVLRCNCKSRCNTLRCSCRKHGLECSAVCGHCKGSACSNSSVEACDSDDE